MGEQGIISRVIGVRAGSVFTFAAATPGEETAPGQIAAKTLRDVYRIDQVDAATKIYGVAGDPIQHSLSPAMMNAAFRRENLNSVYLPLHAKKIEDLVSCIHGIPLHGVSITMPYKEAILEHLDNCEPLCQRIGACNTVIRGQDGKLYGFNTDVAGVVRPIEQRIHPKGAKILVLGAGGAARAAVFGLKERGAEVFILNRTPATAQKLARQAQAKAIKRDDLKKMTFDVIINATPVGMGGNGSLLKRKGIECTAGNGHGLQPSRDPIAAHGARKGTGGDQRRRDVRATGCAAIRDLDGKACARGRDAVRGCVRTESTPDRGAERRAAGTRCAC